MPKPHSYLEDWFILLAFILLPPLPPLAAWDDIILESIIREEFMVEDFMELELVSSSDMAYCTCLLLLYAHGD